MQSDFEFERCGGCGGCGVLKSAREQKGNKRISGVYSRRLGGRANLESDKHAGKPGAFAILIRATKFQLFPAIVSRVRDENRSITLHCDG